MNCTFVSSGVASCRSLARHALILLLFLMQPGHAAPEDLDELTVVVAKQGEAIIVDVSMGVRATPEETWSVITDYDRAAQFIPGLKSSQIVAKSASALTVSQTGIAKFGPLSFELRTVRELQLTPVQTIVSRQVSGNMKSSQGRTQLIPDGSGTRLIYHSESVPGFWLPSSLLIGSIQRQTHDQFLNLRREVDRRKAAGQDFNPRGSAGSV